MRRRTFLVAAAVLSMTMVTSSALAASTITTTTSSTTIPGVTTTGAPSTSAGLACAEQLVSTWSTAQLVNQTIVVPVNAANLGAMVPAATAGYGGLLLFGASAPTTMATTISRVQARTLDKYPMLIMTDEEGGGVQRLTNVIGSVPWAKTMARNLSVRQITAEGRRVGASMLSAGVNVDLAPVLDVDGRSVEPGATDPDGLRSFSGSPNVVASDGTAFMTGLRDAGVISVVKHFPGLGGTSRNTDYGPARTLAWSVLKRSGLVPFEAAISGGAQGVMLSNASVPGLTALPSSLSSVVVGELRQAMGFRGLIMTDSLSAGAVGALRLSVPAAAVKALGAGADMLLFGLPGSAAASLALAHQVSVSIVQAVAAGTLARATLESEAAQVVATRNVVTCQG